MQSAYQMKSPGTDRDSVYYSTMPHYCTDGRTVDLYEAMKAALLSLKKYTVLPQPDYTA
jgi:hypothetical protein